jgi:hypothetical protein
MPKGDANQKARQRARNAGPGATRSGTSGIHQFAEHMQRREFADIEALQNRFKNLKTENDKLMKRKALINQEMEKAR